MGTNRLAVCGSLLFSTFKARQASAPSLLPDVQALSCDDLTLSQPLSSSHELLIPHFCLQLGLSSELPDVSLDVSQTSQCHQVPKQALGWAKPPHHPPNSPSFLPSSPPYGLHFLTLGLHLPRCHRHHHVLTRLCDAGSSSLPLFLITLLM